MAFMNVSPLIMFQFQGTRFAISHLMNIFVKTVWIVILRDSRLTSETMQKVLWLSFIGYGALTMCVWCSSLVGQSNGRRFGPMPFTVSNSRVYIAACHRQRTQCLTEILTRNGISSKIRHTFVELTHTRLRLGLSNAEHERKRKTELHRNSG